jgi:predicted transcriptional regulator
MNTLSLRKGSAERQARINKLKVMLTDKGDKTTEQIIAQFCYEEAVSIRVANEYLDILHLAGILKKD